MSTYWSFECLDHPGGLISDNEFTQHTGDRHYELGIQLISQRPVETDNRYWSLVPNATDAERSDAYFEMSARAFLSDHPTCRLGLISEYGERREVPGQAPTPEEVSALIQAAIAEIAPNFENETQAWNVWINLNASPAFIAAFAEMRRHS